MMITLSLISLLLCCITIVSFFKNKYIKTCLSILFGAFFCLEVSSLYLGNSFIDYKYYLHFSLNLLSMAGGFVFEIILFFFLLIIISCIIFFASKIRISTKKWLGCLIKLSIIVITLLILILPKEGVFQKLKEIYVITFNADNRDFNKLLKTFELTPKELLQVSPEGKNIIIISLESFDKAFLHDDNRQLTPNLRRLKEEWTFYNMEPNYGSTWTAGSLYMIFTGIPSFFIGHPNIYLKGTTSSKLISLSDILKHNKYEMYHISNDADFAGTKDMLNAFGVQHIIDGKTCEGKYPELPVWGGPYDKDVFAEAKHVIKNNDTGKSFMIFLATMQTHAPNGIIDERMLNVVEQQASDLQTAALSTDWLIGDFISFLENEDLLKNTVVYIFPDHSIMGKNAIIDKTNEKRGLWFLTNADKKDLQIDNDNFYQIDLLPTILSGAGIKHNAKFLSDYITTEDKNEFITKNMKTLSALNTSATVRDNTIGTNLCIKKSKNDLIFLTENDTIFTAKINELKNKNAVLTLNRELRIMSKRLMSDEEFENIFSTTTTKYNTYVKVYIRKKGIGVELFKDNKSSYTIKPDTEIRLNNKQITDILNSLIPDIENINNTTP